MHVFNQAIINSALRKKVLSAKRGPGSSLAIILDGRICCTLHSFRFISTHLWPSSFSFKFFFNIKIKPFLYLKKGNIIIRSLNGFIIIDYEHKIVHKYLMNSFEPNFLSNELIARFLYKSNTPKILSLHTQKNYNGFSQELVYRGKTVFWDDWHTSIRELFSIITSSNLFRRRNLAHKLEELRGSLDLAVSTDQYFKEQCYRAYSKINFLLDHYSRQILFTFEGFCHGDLTPNNVLVKDGDYMLFDFANGGVHSFSYDLFMQNFYFKDSVVWTRFDELNFISNEDFNVFFGASSFFFQLVSARTGVVFEEHEIKFSLVAALAENFIKNTLRHQSDSYLEGIELIDNIATIADHIIESIKKNSGA